MNDNVTRPAHYNDGDIECIDAIRASMSSEEFQGYAKGAILKYVWRWRQKGGVEDLRKAGVYLGWMIESAEGSAVTVRRAPFDYPWREAPSWANGAVRNREGFIVWLEEEPEWDYDGGDFIWPERREVFTADRNPTEEWPNSWRPMPVQNYDITPGVPPLLNYWRFAPAHKAEQPKAEEAKPIYPWHLAPAQATHAAMDANGLSFWYEGEPRSQTRGLAWIGWPVGVISPPHLFPGDWKDSLEARP